jgi:shikimate dehydrogenase
VVSALGPGTALVALLGKPVGESLSPRMQNAAFAARGLDWAYVGCEVDAERLKVAIEGLAALGFRGANVTAPYKLDVARLVQA